MTFYIKKAKKAYIFGEKSKKKSKKASIIKKSKKAKKSLDMRYFEEMDYRDIAEVMNLKERTIYNFVHEGLTLLRKELRVLVLMFLLCG